MPRTLAQVELNIEAWIRKSATTFASGYREENGRTWMLKFFAPQHLAGFMRHPQLVMSTTAGFTWGDGVYVVPLKHVYSAMIYGRIGVMGWIAADDRRRIYDASDPAGLRLYQEWIQFKPGLFTLLTTTVHSQFANRHLRNAFRRRFKIDLVLFRPDEFNRTYVRLGQDRWCVLSDFAAGQGLPSGTVGFSAKVKDCELVAIGTEEFALDRDGFIRRDMIGSQVTLPTTVRVAPAGTPLIASLKTAYQANRTRGAGAVTFVVTKP